MVNAGTAAITPQLYLQLLRDGNALDGGNAFYSTFTGPAIYTDTGKYQKVEFKNIDKDKAEFREDRHQRLRGHGAALLCHCLVAGRWHPARRLRAQGGRQPVRRRHDHPRGYAAAWRNQGAGRPLCSPARSWKKPLEALAPGLELVKDYGWLTILAKPLYWLLDKIHGILGNWGWSIVGLVLFLKILFYWLNAKAYASMAKMKAINPASWRCVHA